MTGVARITKLDFFIMKSQGISYLSLVAVILLFGLMGSSINLFFHYRRMVYRIDGY